MAGIIYYRQRGAIVLKPKIKGKDMEFLTPLWLMQQVLTGKKSFGHFNPKSDLEAAKKNKKKVVEAEDGD